MGPLSGWGPGQNAPVVTPLVGGPGYNITGMDPREGHRQVWLRTDSLICCCIFLAAKNHLLGMSQLPFWPLQMVVKS